MDPGRQSFAKSTVFSNPHSSCSPCSSNLSADCDIKKEEGVNHNISHFFLALFHLDLPPTALSPHPYQLFHTQAMEGEREIEEE